MIILEFLQFQYVQFALIVGSLTAICASLVGVPLVLKRFSFIGDGLSHVAFGGMAVAAVINLTNNLYIIMPLTTLTAIILLTTGRRTKVKGDAAIAMISVGALAFGYFLMNTFPVKGNVASDVCASLFGSYSMLTLQPPDVWLCVGMSVLVLAVYLIFYNKIFAVTFDAGFLQATGGRAKLYEVIVAVVIGIVVSLSMQLVGSLLMSALIVFPALAAMRVFKNFRAVVICSVITSLSCAILGILISIVWNTPMGATIVLFNILAFLLFFVCGRIFNGKKTRAEKLDAAAFLLFSACGKKPDKKQTAKNKNSGGDISELLLFFSGARPVAEQTNTEETGGVS